MRIILAGSRTIVNKELVNKLINKNLPTLIPVEERDDVIIIEGGAKGVDSLAEEWAVATGHAFIRFVPDWSKGKIAGYLRNMDMANSADGLIAIWDGKSKGTKNMINIAKLKQLKTVVEIVK